MRYLDTCQLRPLRFCNMPSTLLGQTYLRTTLSPTVRTIAPWDKYIVSQQLLPAKRLGQSAVDRQPASPATAERLASVLRLSLCSYQKCPAYTHVQGQARQRALGSQPCNTTLQFNAAGHFAVPTNEHFRKVTTSVPLSWVGCQVKEGHCSNRPQHAFNKPGSFPTVPCRILSRQIDPSVTFLRGTLNGHHSQKCISQPQ